MEHFTLTSGKLRVTDPCYDKDTWCAGVLENVLPGEWQAEAIVASDSVTRWGGRIAELCIWHKDYIGKIDAHELTDVDVGVDSGQAGFFDEQFYPEGESTGEYGDLNTFYGKVCDGTAGPRFEREVLMHDKSELERFEALYTSWGTKPKEEIDEIIRQLSESKKIERYHNYLGIANVGFGVATSSGYGDGGYDCYVGRNKEGQIVAAKIVFIDLNEEDEDEYEFDDSEE